MATPYHLLLGQAPPSSPTIPPQKTCPAEEQPPMAALLAQTPKQSPIPKRCHPSPEPMGSTPAVGGPPNPKKQETPPWFQSLKPSQADAFLRDSELVVEARLYFFSKHSYNFNQDRNRDLSEVFKKLAEKAGLLGTNIYEIEASWTGPEELKQGNYTLQSLPKSLRFPRVVPAMESPKVMGLMGIHDPDTLQHFARFTYCLWCGKEGQNEGSVVNHLRTTHYKLGLVCNKCYGCPTITSNTLCHHSHHNCCLVITHSESVPLD